MTNKMLRSITPSIRQIIEVFEKHQFTTLTLQQLAKELDMKENTVNQRIIRDDNYFFQTRSTKPKIVALNAYRKEIMAKIYKNQCQRCKLKKKLEDLQVIYLDGSKANKEISNLQVICKVCKSKKQPVPNSKAVKKSGISVKNPKKKSRWEYKRVMIRTELNATPRYYKFNEDEFDEFPPNKWFWVEDKDGDIESLTLSAILDFFGNHAWELISLTDLSKKSPTSSTLVGNEILPFYDPRFELYSCVFKRRIPD